MVLIFNYIRNASKKNKRRAMDKSLLFFVKKSRTIYLMRLFQYTPNHEGSLVKDSVF